MYSLSPEGDPSDVVAWLFERLRGIPSVTWDEAIPPAHSSYDDWQVWGTRVLPEASSHRPSKPNSPNVGPKTPASTLASSPEPLQDENLITRTERVFARVSRHTLSLERQYQLAKAFDDLDASGHRHVRTIELFRLPARQPGEHSLCLMLCENPGDNHLREIANFGPNYYRATEEHQLHVWNPDLTASGNNQVGRCSLLEFLDFAIGACEACELLHRNNQSLHGELRPDSFHFDRDSNRVRLLHYGSRVQSFEQGLTSAGWSALAHEFGVEYKLQFVSPEQTGRMPASPDLRTDIYSLGIIFYYVLSGVLPHHGRTALEVMTSMLNRKILPVSSTRLDVPDCLCALIQKMTLKNIEERYHSDSAVLHDLKYIRKFLINGDCDALESFRIAETDVNCFFTLPSIHPGRSEEKEIIRKVIERVSNQKRSTPSPSERIVTGSLSSDSSTTGSPRDSANHREDVVSEISVQSKASPVSLGNANTENSLSSIGDAEEGFSGRYSIEKRTSVDRVYSDLDFRPPSIMGPFEGPKSILKDSRRYKRTHKCDIITISGAAGLGKSTLIASVQAEARTQGYIAATKFDPVKNQPFEGILKLMSSLFRQIFSESNVNTDFHNNLRSFVRPVWGILQSKSMLDLPEWLIGSPHGYQIPHAPSTNSFSATQAGSQSSRRNSSPSRQRFNNRDLSENSIAEFLKSGTCVKSSRFMAIYMDVLRFLCIHKFILLSLDDLHNADNESLGLIDAVVNSRIPLVLILAFRDKTELPRRAVSIIENKASNITRINLEPLSEEQISEYVEATMHRSPEYVFPLVAVISERTNGNPFFVREMLELCHQKKCIWYSWDDSQWQYDLDEIFVTFEDQEYGSQMNSEFISDRLREFPEDCRALLSWAALLGNTFSFPLVKQLMLVGRSLAPGDPTPGVTANSKADLVRQSSQDVVKALQTLLSAYIIEPAEERDQFRFCHDRFQQSAVSLSGTMNIPEKHFHIAQLLSSKGKPQDQLFVAASHICKSVDVIKQRIRIRRPYREVLVQAAERTIESGGRAAGLTYFSTALDLLQEDPWNSTLEDVSYLETLKIFTRTAEAYWYQGQMPVELLQHVIDNGRQSIDKTPAWILLSRVYARKGDNVAAFRALKICLTSLGIEISDATWDECDQKFYELLGELAGTSSTTDWEDPQVLNDVERTVMTELFRRPLSDDSNLATITSVLAELLATAFWTDHLLFYHIALIEFDIYLHRGTTTQAPLAYVHLATCAIVRFGLVELGCLLGDQAQKLFARFEHDAYTVSKGRTLYFMLLGHFNTPMYRIVPALEDNLQAALTSGERAAGIMTVGVLSVAKFWASQDLNEVEAYCTFGAEEIIDWKDDARGGVYLTAIRQYCRALQGKTNIGSGQTILSDSEHDTKSYLDWITTCSSTPRRSRAPYLSFLLPALVIFGYYEDAAKVGDELIVTMPQQWSVRFVSSNRFYLSVAYAALLFENPAHPNRQTWTEYIQESHYLLTKWGHVNNANFFVWSSVLSALLSDFDKKHQNSLQSFEKALDHAELYSMTFEQAHTSELFSEFLVRKGARRPARHILRDSVAAYRRISAFGKADHLELKHEWLLKGTSTLNTTDASCQTTGFEEPIPQIGPPAAIWPAATATRDLKNPQGLEAVGLDMIDLTSILESSNVLASELNIDRLLSKMTTIIRETTSAELCAIVVKQDDSWVVAAISDNSDRIYPSNDSLENVEDVVGKQITLYTLRSSETIFLRNVYEDDRFSNAPESYRRRNPDGKAVICQPILHGNQALLGAVYIEGPPYSFAERNVTVLRLLVTSITASIKNATLFKRVEKVSQQNAAMLESQRTALAQAREAEKKAKLAEAEALRNVKLKEEAARAKSLFLANVSHELRTPLNGVIGLSELLKNSKLDLQQEDWCQSIRVCGDTLLQVINDILDFSKLEAGKMQIFAVPLSLTETIAEVVRALRYSNLEKEHIEIILDLDLDKGLLVIGDPVRLHQILMNLLSNSFKFTSKGHIKVAAKVDLETDKDVQVTCSVSDTGVGISEEQKRKLFLPFSQADNSTARSFGGTGLGLSICKGIIENIMKGRIWLESQAGVGTKVSFSLKFAKASRGSSLNSKEADPMSVFSPSNEDEHGVDGQTINLATIPRDQLRVCIAEDNAINAKIAISFVQKLGFKCEAFGDGRQAVDALTAASANGNPFHICLMDCQMPNLDGYDATREIRNHPDPHVRGLLVIAMTASAIRGDRERCLEAGMNNYLAKPVRQQMLKQMIEGYLINARDVMSGPQESPANQTNGDSVHGAGITLTPTSVNSRG